MIHPEKLERYRDFVEIHSDLVDGQLVYNPNKALTGLLSVLSPDPKVVLLAGMNEGTIYFTNRQLSRDVLTWLNNLGVVPAIFPITISGVWSYLEFTNNQQKYDGSLVELGAVVKHAHLVSTWGDDRTGYIKSRAGSELAVPLLPYACEFVFRAGQSSIEHRFDSMWRIIGAAHSSTDQRRPWAVFKVTEFLMHNPGQHRVTDLTHELVGQIYHRVISRVLNNLGNAGIIDYRSPHRDIEGKKSKGWSRYQLKDGEPLQDIDRLYRAIKREKRYFKDKRLLAQVAEYILHHPDIVYEANALAERFEAKRLEEHKPVGLLGLLSRILSMLERVKVLQSAEGLKGGQTHTQAAANDLTRMFYDIMVLPTKAVADSLTPSVVKPLDPPKLTYLLQNYQTERSQIGPAGGEEVRNSILAILANYPEPMKLSHIAQKYNQHTDRQLARTSIFWQLRSLNAQGLVKSPKKSYYCLVYSPSN